VKDASQVGLSPLKPSPESGQEAGFGPGVASTRARRPPPTSPFYPSPYAEPWAAPYASSPLARSRARARCGAEALAPVSAAHVPPTCPRRACLSRHLGQVDLDDCLSDGVRIDQVMTPHLGRDETCPVSTGGGTRRVQSVRGEGRDVSS
jgi:hypothetical protein